MKRIRSSKILSSADERLGDADAEAEGEADPEGEADLEADFEGDEEGDCEAEPELLGLGEDDPEADGDWDGLGDLDDEDEWLNPSKPSSFMAWPQERVSTAFLISRLLPNLKAPLIPRSANELIPPSQLFISKIGISLY